MIDWSKNRKFMAWTFSGNSRMYGALNDYGNKMDTIGIFTFEVQEDGRILETGTDVASLLPYVERWKHIQWLLTIMNHGHKPTFDAIRENMTVQDKFISEIHRILDKYPWSSGIDIDLERGGNEENTVKANALFKRIYKEVKSRPSGGKRVHADLPAMAGPGLSVGGENWCNYAQLDPYLDTMTLMSYGMAWAGSAPGPISPTWWIEDIFDYATTVVDPAKLTMGLPGYGFHWQLYDKPKNLGMNHRGFGFSYNWALNWMTGDWYTHQDKDMWGPETFPKRQHKIPFVGYRDWDDMTAYSLLHVYDYLDAWDSIDEPEFPRRKESYGGREFLTTYDKAQKNTSTGLIAEIDGTPFSSSGSVNLGDGNASLRNPYPGDSPGKLTYRIYIPVAGAYDLMANVNFPWWDKNSITFKFDGTVNTTTENRLWYPYWRRVHWIPVRKQHYFTKGNHDIVIDTASTSVQIWGFQVSEKAGEEATTGGARYSLKPRKFKDIDGIWTAPEEYILTTEALRRDPESAMIWYEDFRDYGIGYRGELPDWFITNSGEWDVYWEKGGGARPYSELQGTGDLNLDYNNFRDVHMKATIALDKGFKGKGGIYVGDLYLAVNYPAQKLELYQKDVLVKSINYSISYGEFATITMRIRGNSVRVYTGTNENLRFKVTATTAPGKVGFRANGGTMRSKLMRLGDAWWYMPQEKFDVTLPDGTKEHYGKLERPLAEYESDFGMFKLTQDIEEIDSRVQGISMDYDYEHSRKIKLTAGKDYEITIDNADVGVWTSKIYLGDADGFSVMYYSDVDTLIHFANKAAYEYKLYGVALWSLGQEDLRVWQYLPDMVPNPYE